MNKLYQQDQLRQLRLLHNFTLQGVAASLQISQATYARIEYGMRDLKLREAQLLSRLYHIPLAEFFIQAEYPVQSGQED